MFLYFLKFNIRILKLLKNIKKYINLMLFHAKHIFGIYLTILFHVLKLYVGIKLDFI